jgi:hypothetical protein
VSALAWAAPFLALGSATAIALSFRAGHDRATPAGDHGGDARAKWKAALAAHNAAKRRGRFTRAAKKTGPGMIRRPPPGGGDAA